MLGPSATAARPARTESPRWAPPAMKEVRESVERKLGGEAASAGGRTTTTWATSGCSTNGCTARSTTGIPRISWNCLGGLAPKRVPCPAATTMVATSRGKCLHQLIHAFQSHERRAGHLYRAPRRAEDSGKPEPDRFGDAPVYRTSGTDLSAQTDFAQEYSVGRRGTVMEAGKERSGDGQIGAGLGNPNACRHLYKHVEIGKGRLRAALQHREEHRQPTRIYAGGHSLRRTVARLGRERLDLDQHRPGALHE